MLLPEDVAKEKVCPFSGLANLISKNLADTKEVHCCVGSECMLWRWGTEKMAPSRIIHTIDWETKEPSKRPEGVPDGWGFQPAFQHATRYTQAYWFETKEMYAKRLEAAKSMRGYCGLAGKPE